MALIIVESPTKARTFNRILKIEESKKSKEQAAEKPKKKGASKKAAKEKAAQSPYFVYATMGHIRDLPGKEIGIEFDHDFKPKYQLIEKRAKVIEQLKALASEHDEIILATDLDREGESISYHIAVILDLIKENWPDFTITADNKKLKRIVFHEITATALKEALANPSTLRTELVKAQQARRILDRVVGYELSPLLWKKTGKNWLSAGRVQTVAVRLIVEREREREEFPKDTYLTAKGVFEAGGVALEAVLTQYRGESVEKKTVKTLFAGDYEYTSTILPVTDKETIETELKTDSYTVTSIEESMASRFPPPPFTTSTLQQDAFFKLGFSSKMVMNLAQRLYEKGLITYHRTDSFNLSSQFVFRAKDYITETFGAEYALEKPRGYRTRSRMAQEAHEAIRPTRLVPEKKIESKDKSLTVNHKKLYALIFERSVATQMKEAQIKTVKVTFGSPKQNVFVSSQNQVLFDGFLKLYNRDFYKDPPPLGDVKQGVAGMLGQLELPEKLVAPPPRYNEASLIRILEEKGIGRPSTYAAIISLIQEKGYVEKDGRYFLPTPLGNAISNYLAAHFGTVVDLTFTSGLENKLDEIAEGKTALVEVLREFYTPFHTTLTALSADKETIEVKEDAGEPCPTCGKPLLLRYSKFGKFYACSGYPACRFTKPFLHLVKNRKCPKCGAGVVVKFSKAKKRFYGCAQYPNCDFASWTLAGTVAVPNEQEKKT